jgi:hypothetical protein
VHILADAGYFQMEVDIPCRWWMFHAGGGCFSLLVDQFPAGGGYSQPVVNIHGCW